MLKILEILAYLLNLWFQNELYLLLVKLTHFIPDFII